MFKRLLHWIEITILTKPDSVILNQRHKLLLTKLEKIKFEKQITSNSHPIVIKIEELFAKRQTWTNLSQIEIYMVSLYSEDEAALELKLLLLESKEKLSNEMVCLFEKEASEDHKKVNKTVLLNSLYGKLHVSDDLENLEKSFIAKTRVRTGMFFFLAIFLFFTADQVHFLAEALSITKGDEGDGILTAMAAGLMGATFSMLVGLRQKLSASSLQDLKIIHRLDYLFSRTIIGLTSGLLMFYILQAKMLTGPFFPEINAVKPILDDRGNALLVIWSFLSGFSEKLVPDLLAKTEEKTKKM